MLIDSMVCSSLPINNSFELKYCVFCQVSGTNGCNQCIKQQKGEWQEFDNDIREILQVADRRDLDQRLKFMTTIIVSMATERFGFVDIRYQEKNLQFEQERAKDKRTEERKSEYSGNNLNLPVVKKDLFYQSHVTS